MSWRDHIKVHPAADLFPMMSESELRELGEDIKENGQRVQVVLWKDPSPGGEYWLIDGRNRLDAMELAGLCVFDKIGRQKFFWRLMDGDPYEVVLSLNLLRRNLTDGQRRELIGKIIKAKPEASNVTIAKETGTSEPTVRRVRNGLSSSGDEVDQRTGRAAARPQAKKPRPKPERSRSSTAPPAAKRSILNSAGLNTRRSMPSRLGRLLILIAASSAPPVQSGTGLRA